MSSSKYIEMSTISVYDFARSRVGTTAKFLLSTLPEARQKASSTIKAACSKYRTACELKGISILIEQPDGVWLPSSMLVATIVEKAAA